MNADEAQVFDLVRNYFIDRGKEVRVQMCSGVYVVMPEDYKNPDVDHMLDCARVAEKKVRDTVKDGYQFYNPSQWEKGKWISDVVGHLKFAIRELFYSRSFHDTSVLYYTTLFMPGSGRFFISLGGEI